MKKEIEPKVTVVFTDGWEERFMKATYELYLKVKADKSRNFFESNLKEERMIE